VATVGREEAGAFQVVVDGVLVFFSYVKYEWSQAGVAVIAVLPVDGCAADRDDYACGCFADFYG
jgi:hypothetical protein